MTRICRTLGSLLFALSLLVACSPSGDKPVTPAASASGAGAAVSSSASAAPAVASEAGHGQYTLLATPQPTESAGKIEVLEFFGYFCSHCYALDPKIHTWVNKQGNRIAFKRIPINEDEAKLYYALEAMGKIDALHDKIFNAVQVERQRLNSESAAAQFVEQQGIDKAAFVGFYNSFSVQSKAQQAAALAKAYGIDGVPMVAIDGRFITSATHAANRPGTVQNETGFHLSMLAIMDELVAKARQERAQGAYSTGK